MLAAIYAPALILATNPNTPTEVLLNLGAEFPEQLLDNPVFFLLLLENLNLVEQMPVTTLHPHTQAGAGASPFPGVGSKSFKSRRTSSCSPKPQYAGRYPR